MKQALLSLIGGAIAAFVLLQFYIPQQQSNRADVQEQSLTGPINSVYDRVMKTGVVRCGYVIWPPYYDLDPNTGQLEGFFYDRAVETLAIVGLKPEFTAEVVIGQQVSDLQSGKIDAICGDGPWNIPSAKYIDYTAPIDYYPVYIYVRANEERIKEVSDLNSEEFTIVAMDSDLSEELARKIFSKAQLKTLPAITDPASMLTEVALAKADAVIVDIGMVDEYEKNNPGKLKMLDDEPIGVYPGGFSVKKGEDALLNTLNMAIEMAHNTGVYDRLSKKYEKETGLLFKGHHYFEPIKKYKD